MCDSFSLQVDDRVENYKNQLAIVCEWIIIDWLLWIAQARKKCNEKHVAPF